MNRLIRTAALLVLVSGCTKEAEVPVPATAQTTDPTRQTDLKADHARWVAERDASLRKPDGWAALIGLHWLQGDVQRIGSGDGNDVRLLIGPAALGTVKQHDGVVSFVPASGSDVTVDGQPVRGALALKVAGKTPGTTLAYDGGKGKINLIQRGDALALRVHHADAPTRAHFAGLDFWPAEPSWVVNARFVAHPAGKSIAIVNVIGHSSDVPNPGYVEFEKDGRTWTLEAFGDPAKSLSLMFKDATSGKESYGVGRYLEVGPVRADGHLAIDFNRAYNPPCAYTDFATCPIPPRENHLVQKDAQGGPSRLAVLAGEKAYKGHES
ncbi:MAG: DUF1684 domain-containing protein [Pseudoxanthomonas sp.]